VRFLRGNPNTRADLMKVVEDAIVRIMMVNFAVMDIKVQSVPTTGSTGSLRSRGYLLGVAEAVIQQFSAMEPTQDEFVAASPPHLQSPTAHATGSGHSTRLIVSRLTTGIRSTARRWVAAMFSLPITVIRSQRLPGSGC
jgi:hypothetical protein